MCRLEVLEHPNTYASIDLCQNNFIMQKLRKQTRNAQIVKTVLLIALATFLCTSCDNDDDSTIPSELSTAIENQNYVSIIEEDIASLPINTQVAIALVHNGTTEYLGVINDNNVLKGINNADRVFEIGSITKAFTGVCLSKMIATNEASRNETLQDQFEFTIPQGGDITLEQLANHTSGLPRLPNNADEVVDFNINNPYVNYSAENLQSYLENSVTLNSPSGTEYAYSNLGMGVLGYALARKRNVGYEELLQDIIFNPLGMTSTTTVRGNVDASKLVEPRDINGNIVSHWDFSETTAAGGSIKSSVTDMSKFMLKNLENDEVFNFAQAKTFNIGNGFFMGLGWNIYEAEGFSVLNHNGGTGGFSSMLMLDKEKEIGVLVLSNAADYNDAVEELCNSLFLQIYE